MPKPITISELEDISLDASQGFLAMSFFLRDYFDRTHGTGELAPLLGDVELELDGTSTDPAALSDWLACVNRVLAGKGLEA